MKTTTTINLNNSVFHIDEDAYQKLKDYLRSIEKKLEKNGSTDEIMQDIEARIAELLFERIGPGKQVITISDIQEVIVILGNASDFEEDTGSTNQKSYVFSKVTKRMFRDPDQRVLGGVCGGLGAYFNMDPLWFRILFLVVFLVGGSGLLIYLIMWIIIPEAKTTAQKLEMRGEPVNIENIKRAVREEFEHVKRKMKGKGSKKQ